MVSSCLQPTFSPNNILIVKLSAIGDVIHALPVAYALKEQYPKARITWIVEKGAVELLLNNPCIDEVIIFDKSRCRSLIGLFQYGSQLASLLRTRHFDLALDLQGLFKSAVITWLSGAPRRMGYCNMRELSQWVSTPVCGANSTGHVVDRYLDVARAVGCDRITNVAFPVHITQVEADDATAIAAEAGLNMDQSYVVLAPGTNWLTKCWPTTRFAELADRLHAVGVVPVIIGGPGDVWLAKEIARLAHNALIDLTGKTTLKQLAYIIRRSRVFVGGDTGPMHLAAALGTPVVALFGPTDPSRNGPYGTLHTVVQSQEPCGGCWKRRCPKEFVCMKNILADKVYEQVKTMIGA